jgi:hypothetical protein
MTFEDQLARLTAFYFFREFTFAKNQFKPEPSLELELADAVIWLDDFLIVTQVKERNAPTDTTPEREENWFKDSVLGTATRQIRNTLSYLQKYGSIEIRNEWGHVFDIAAANVNHPHKLVVYNPHELLPERCASKKYHKSSTAGVIHLIPSSYYLEILQTLVTPSEVHEYFLFRETLIDTWGELSSEVPEQAILGQYLRNLPNERPSVTFAEYLAALKQKRDEWDISHIIRVFAERRNTPQKSPTDYYRILVELAKLNRTDMRLFKERFALSMGKANLDEFASPYRFTGSTGCGFLFVPLQRAQWEERHDILKTLTHLNKYDLQLARCVGLTFVSEGKETWCDVQWCRIEFPWKENGELGEFLKGNNPFRPIKEKRIERYGLAPAEE